MQYITDKPVFMALTPTAFPNDTMLVAGLLAREESAYAELYRRYGAMIIGHVRKNNGSQEDGTEIVQITMVKLYVALREERYREQGKMGHYVFQLAANSWREELRRRRNRGTSALDDIFEDPADPGEADITIAVVKDRQLLAMHRALNRLGSPCRELINSYHLKKEKLKDLAVKMNCNYNSLRKRLFDCRRKLRMATEQSLQE